MIARDVASIREYSVIALENIMTDFLRVLRGVVLGTPYRLLRSVVTFMSITNKPDVTIVVRSF